jgi:hypothetical protein
MSRSDRLREALQSAAYLLLSLADDDGAPTSLSVTAHNDVTQVTIVLAPADTAARNLTPALSPIERAIVEALGAQALKGAAIKRRLSGQVAGTTLRTLLANLVNRGVLQVTSEGYRVLNYEIP